MSPKHSQLAGLLQPNPNTPVCLKHTCSYRDHLAEFAALDPMIVGISAQDLNSLRGKDDRTSTRALVNPGCDEKHIRLHLPMRVCSLCPCW
jgi:hypothetical protein